MHLAAVTLDLPGQLAVDADRKLIIWSVFGVGTAVAVPALALMGGGALILGLAGYGAAGLVEGFLKPVPDLLDLASSSALVLVGTALLIDGARRVAKDPDVASALATFKNNVLTLLRLSKARIIDSLPVLAKYYESELVPFLKDVATNPKSAAATAALAVLGVAGGNAVAVSSVTLLGSGSLGALGLSLGIVSAPVWPLIAGGGIAVAAAYGVWRYMKQREPGTTQSAVLGNGLSPPRLPGK